MIPMIRALAAARQRPPDPYDDLPCIHCGRRIGPEYGRLSDESGTHRLCHPRRPKNRPDCYTLVFNDVEQLGSRRGEA